MVNDSDCSACVICGSRSASMMHLQCEIMTEDWKPYLPMLSGSVVPSLECDILNELRYVTGNEMRKKIAPSLRTGYAALRDLLTLMSQELATEPKKSDSLCQGCARLLSCFHCLTAHTRGIASVLTVKLEANRTRLQHPVEVTSLDSAPIAPAEVHQSMPESFLIDTHFLELDGPHEDRTLPSSSLGAEVDNAIAVATSGSDLHLCDNSSDHHIDTRLINDPPSETHNEDSPRAADVLDSSSSLTPTVISIEIRREDAPPPSPLTLSPEPPQEEDPAEVGSDADLTSPFSSHSDGVVQSNPGPPPPDPPPTFIRTDTSTQCSDCDAMFKERAECRHHMRQDHAAKKVYLCSLCPLAFLARNALYEHESGSHAAGPLLPHSCGRCGGAFATARLLREHQDSEHRQPLSCQHCRRTFRKRQLLQAHQAVHRNERPFRCASCGKRFTKRLVWRNHQATHGPRRPRHQCTQCERTFLSAASLRAHQRLHERPLHSCDLCPQQFRTEARLRNHRTQHTGVKPHACPECAKTFSRRSLLLDHSRTHTGERPFVCDLCGIGFSQRSNLSVHKNAVHLNHRPHQCPLCEKAFKRKQMLQRHQATCHSDKNASDSTQNDAAASSGHQQGVHGDRDHQQSAESRLHGNGERPFRCGVCDRAFKDQRRCRTHMFTHTDKRPFECRVCGAGFMRRERLLGHMRQLQHGSGPDDYVFNHPVVAEPKVFKAVVTDAVVAESAVVQSVVTDPEAVKAVLTMASVSQSLMRSEPESRRREQEVVEHNVGQPGVSAISVNQRPVAAAVNGSRPRTFNKVVVVRARGGQSVDVGSIVSQHQAAASKGSHSYVISQSGR